MLIEKKIINLTLITYYYIYNITYIRPNIIKDIYLQEDLIIRCFTSTLASYGLPAMISGLR